MSSFLDDASLLDQFEACTLPGAKWTHEAHLRVAIMHLWSLSSEEAIDVLRERIRAYNSATGVPNSLTRGYHETITVAWVSILSARLTPADMRLRTLHVLARHPDLLSSDLLGAHYSAAVLKSPIARATFVPPDLQPFPPRRPNPRAPVSPFRQVTRMAG